MSRQITQKKPKKLCLITFYFDSAFITESLLILVQFSLSPWVTDLDFRLLNSTKFPQKMLVFWKSINKKRNHGQLCKWPRGSWTLDTERQEFFCISHDERSRSNYYLQSHRSSLQVNYKSDVFYHEILAKFLLKNSSNSSRWKIAIRLLFAI